MTEYKGFNYAKDGNTYTLYTKEGEPWIIDFKTENAVKEQIDDIVVSQEKIQQEKTKITQLEEQITDLQLALAELVEGGTL